MKAFAFDAAFFETLPRATWARVVTTKFFDQFFVAANDTVAALYGGFAVESPSGVYSSTQKLKSGCLVRIVASCFEEAREYSKHGNIASLQKDKKGGHC